jgi:polyisoprenoid-binding protein YceI
MIQGVDALHSPEEEPMTALATTPRIAAGTWVADPAHSRVEFTVKHLGIATVRGNFGTFEGSAQVGDDLAGSAFTATIDTASINTNEEQRDAHLRSADFFDAEANPQLTFESTSVEPLDGERFRVKGNLTMHGVTREVEVEATIQGTETDPWGNERIGLEITGQLSRGDFGMEFNQVLGSGNLVVSDKVKLNLDISAIKQA